MTNVKNCEDRKSRPKEPVALREQFDPSYLRTDPTATVNSTSSPTPGSP
jgi:hypothetical protein